MHYWGGCPTVVTSKWLRSVMLINKCAEHGWRNWVVLSRVPEDLSLIEPIMKAGCEIIYQPRSKGNFDLSSIMRNVKLFRKLKCDVLHCYNDHTSPLIAAMLTRVPVKIWSKLSMSSYYEQGKSPKGLQKLMLSTWITCLFSNRILSISDMAGKEICEQVGFKDKIVTVHAPVPIARFVSAKSTGVRERLGINESDIIVTSVGRTIPVKGWDIAITAFSIVYKEVPNAKLLLVGEKNSSEYCQKICQQINQYGLVHNVIFTGSRSDIPEILKASNLFILPSRSEGTPAALIEAMAVGLPCIASETGGVPEVIEHERNGLMFQRENADDLAEKIINIISDSKLQAQLSKMAQNNLQKFAIETYVNSVFSHYENLLNESNW